MPLFSVIIPIYNSEEYLAKCLDSVINQTCKDFECILVNDGSTDSSNSIITSYTQKDPRLKTIYKSNGGYTSAMNLGLDIARGNYLLFLGSDDTFNVNLLSKLKDEIIKNNPDIIFFKATKIYSNRSELDPYSNFDTYLYINNLNIKQIEKTHKNHLPILFHRDTCKCYKANIVGKIRYVGKTGFDSDGVFAMEVISHCISASWIPYDGYGWYIRDNSVSGSKPKLSTLIDRITVWNYFLTKTIENNIIFPQCDGIIENLKYINDILKIYAMLSVNNKTFDRLMFRRFSNLLDKVEKKYHIRPSLKNKVFRLEPVLLTKAYMFKNRIK